MHQRRFGSIPLHLTIHLRPLHMRHCLCVMLQNAAPVFCLTARLQQLTHSFASKVELASMRRLLHQLHCESKACAAELDHISTAGSDSPRKSLQGQQLQRKQQALEQCIADAKAHVSM